MLLLVLGWLSLVNGSEKQGGAKLSTCATAAAEPSRARIQDHFSMATGRAGSASSDFLGFARRFPRLVVGMPTCYLMRRWKVKTRREHSLDNTPSLRSNLFTTLETTESLAYGVEATI